MRLTTRKFTAGASIILPMDTSTRLNELLARLKVSATPELIAECIAEFNARPARRSTDLRIQGWRVIYPTEQNS